MNVLSRAVQGRFVAFLDRHLPERTKRLIFLASLSARLKNSTSLNQDTLVRLNQVMALASDDSAMKLPVHLSRAIWHDTSFQAGGNESILQAETLSTECIGSLSKEISERTPFWLRYETIRQDVQKLLDNRSTVFGT